MSEASCGAQYVLELAEGSYEWYRQAALKARRYHRLTEILQLVGSATIPLSAVLLEGNTAVPATLGAAVVVITGLRSAFHWHEDYLRFNQAREAVEAERRLYRTGAEPYNVASSRDQLLAKAVTAIEQREMGAWLKIAGAERENLKEHDGYR
ncbi:DUF4231 domain-containing protein [Nocardia sp. NPDC051463]|uniref:DUF4231 domain-containing protein n=1 Tax=Nocardia sp. NPDC051463 TaxID=3154845 RepID=UPI0034140E98